MTKRHSIDFAAYLALVLTLLVGCGDDTATPVGPSDQAAETGTTSERREIALSVPAMNCPMCPITVRRALAGVDGVLKADASLKDKQARVAFDPARTDIDALLAAVAEAGFSGTGQDKSNE